jgi:hypothetical protein
MKHLTSCLIFAALLCAACDKPAEKPAAQPAAPNVVAESATDKPSEQGTDKPAEAVQAPAPDADPSILGLGATPADIETDAPHQYGAKFASDAAPLALGEAIRRVDSEQGPFKVQAEVEKVCQVKGCWFTLKAPDVPIPVRVRMKGYAFFVPKNATGGEAVLEGTFKKVTIDQPTAQHYADDEAKATGKPARKVEGPEDAYEFEATAIQITRLKT